jgi:hypothetical protein
MGDRDRHDRCTVSFIGGVAAVVLGGPFTDLGTGAGGLGAIPSLLLDLTAVAIGAPASVLVARQLRTEAAWLRATATAGGGLWIIAVGYFVIAHWVDPCVNGWWDSGTRIGSQPLCERFGNELNWHTRVHLLAHAAPATILVVGYVWAVRRWVVPARSDVSHVAASAPDRTDQIERSYRIRHFPGTR